MRFHERVEELVISYGEKFIEIACQPLPDPLRVTRHEEWCAEFPAILDDYEKPWSLRIAALLAYSADQIRGTWRAREHRDQLGLTGWLLGTSCALCLRAVTSLTFMTIFFIGNGMVTLGVFVVFYLAGVLLGIALGTSMLGGAWNGVSFEELAGIVALKVGCALLVGLVGLFAGALGGMFHGATHGAIVLGISSGAVLGLGGGLTTSEDTEPIGAALVLVTLIAAVTKGLVHGVRSSDELTCDVGRALAVIGAALGVGLTGTPSAVPIIMVLAWLVAYICRACLVYRLSDKALDHVSAEQLASVLTAISGQLPLDATPWDSTDPGSTPDPPGGKTSSSD